MALAHHVPSAPPCEDALFGDLCKHLRSYMDDERVANVAQAYMFGAQAHAGQTRKSGEPYISHPVAVAHILADMHLDEKSVIAALLHDVIEDTPTAKEELAETFGEEVAELVDGVSKLGQMHFSSKAEAQAASFRKMMMAMVKDIRVILIKLADRLHNMRTLGVMRPDKRRRIARETLDIYVPIANRLGINSIRHELEDLCFQAMYPLRYKVLAKAVQKARGNRKEIIHSVEETLQERLQSEGIQARIAGREKRIYSLYRKMSRKRLPFRDVFDVFAVRIEVDSVDDCYRTLGVVHNLYKPLPGRFKDYIAIPKANGYQSLHTVLFGPNRMPIEVQIRTEEMHRFAESGIASHWLYKGGDSSASLAQARARNWLKGLLEMQQQAGDSIEFLENVKVDLFPDEVYVFTPQGEIMELPADATPVDFAYSVHTDIGNTCVACKIDHRLMPLSTRLQNGQTVEIITAPGAHPNPNWLSFAVTARARTSIRHFLKSLHREEATKLGRRMLEKALAAQSLNLDTLPDCSLQIMLKEYDYQAMDELYEAIGLGQRMAPLVARLLSPADQAAEAAQTEGEQYRQPIAIRGTEGMVVTYAKCCHPIPGDSIVGYLSAGRGIVIHRKNCKNSSTDVEHEDKWLDVTWSEELHASFQAEIRVDARNRRGGLATIAAAVAETGADIDNVHFDDSDSGITAITLLLGVENRVHLARVMRRIRRIEQVVGVHRTSH